MRTIIFGLVGMFLAGTSFAQESPPPAKAPSPEKQLGRKACRSWGPEGCTPFFKCGERTYLTYPDGPDCTFQRESKPVLRFYCGAEGCVVAR